MFTFSRKVLIFMKKTLNFTDIVIIFTEYTKNQDFILENVDVNFNVNGVGSALFTNSSEVCVIFINRTFL